MKPSLVLLGACSSALAFRDSKIISSSSGEMCISSQLLAASSSNPICRNKDGADLLSGSGRGRGGDQFSLAGSIPPSPTTPHSNWTHTSPCFRNGTDSPEFCIYHAAHYGGKGMSIITDAERAAHITRNWGFTRPQELEGVNRPLPKFEVAKVPGKDYGLVATIPIRRGEVILRETASLLIDYAAFTHVPLDEMKKLQVHAIDYLPFNHRSQWLNMSSHGFQGDHTAMVDKILLTNSFDVEMDDVKRDDDFYAVFHRLKTDESDRRIEQIASLREEFNDYTPASRATPQMAELLISLYEQENNWSLLSEAYTLAAIEYNGVGEPWLATKYARLAVEAGLMTLWEGHGDVVEMTKLAEDPWSHWSWMLRTRKRYSWGPGSRPNQSEDEDEDDE
ncbi:lysine methyltransferase [Colletotrichum higginsianum]|nr:lysine methyltransferase [Colletotrichum higginsianum]